MVFQKPTPFPKSIYENVVFGVRLHEKLSKAEMDERVEWSLTRAALWNEVKDRLHTSALGLSGGQQQRLCIARSIAVRPEVLLLDEPTSALDPISTLKIEELIDELKRISPSSSSPITCSRPAVAPTRWRSSIWATGRSRPFQPDFHRPAAAPHAGIHHRPVRLKTVEGEGTMADETKHIVTSFGMDLKKLHDMIAVMGGLVERALADAIAALLERDTELAARVVEMDPKIDAEERAVEQFAVRLLALRQPVADDLRQVIQALKVVTNLERIGDYAANIAKRSLVLNQTGSSFSLSGLGQMSMLVQQNLKSIIDAVGNSDTQKAIAVWRRQPDGGQTSTTPSSAN